MDFVMKDLPIKLLLACSSGLISTSNYALAENVVDTIIVTANRRPQPLSQVGSSVSVLTADDLERNQQSFVLDALEGIPGVAISQNGSFGGTASVSLRGAGGDRTVLLIDGVQLNDVSSTGGAYNFGTLDTYNIERIEVLRGPQSTLYGSDAIGGVINIITKTGGDGFGGKMFVEGGSFNTQRGGANIYGGDEKLGFNLSASGFNTGGISAADENDGNTEKDGLKSYNFNGKLTSQLSENFRLEALSRYSDNSGKFDSFGPTDGNNISNTDEFSGTVRGYLDLVGGRFTNTISGEYSDINRQNLTNDVQTFEAQGERINLDYLGVFTVDQDWTVTGGLQHEQTKSKTASEEKFSINSVFGELAFTGVEGLVFTSGVRYDDHETFGGKTTFRVTGSYEFAETGTRLIANWGEGFKAPSIFQLTFFCCGQTGPNIDLKPERATGYEIGFEQSIMDDHILLNATYFHLKVKDAIDFDFSLGYVNINNTRSEGFELGVQAEVINTVRFNGSYTYTDAKNLADNSQLIREPKHRVSGSLAWSPTDQISTSVNVVHNGAEKQSSFSPVQTLDAWTRVDIRASYELVKDLSIYGRVDNILDKEYQHVPGYGTPDRSYYLGIRKTF